MTDEDMYDAADAAVTGLIADFGKIPRALFDKVKAELPEDARLRVMDGTHAHNPLWWNVDDAVGAATEKALRNG